MSTPTFDLYCLQDDVLLLSNDDFYNFVTQVSGKLEADILKIQGIRSAKAVVRSPDLLAIFKLDCDAVNELKKQACWQCKNNEFVVKQGVELNLKILAEALKDKHEKYLKKIQQQQQQQKSTRTLMTATTKAMPYTDIIDDQTPSNQVVTSATASSSAARSSEINTTAAPVSVPMPFLPIDYITNINDLIEKYSRKMFLSTTLKDGEHYQLTVTQENQMLKALIKCQCGAKISLTLRSQPSSFILSNYYAHLANSYCSIVTKILREEQKKDPNPLKIQSWSVSGSQSSSETTPIYDNDDQAAKTTIDKDDLTANTRVDNDDLIVTKTSKRKHVNHSSSAEQTSASNKKQKR